MKTPPLSPFRGDGLTPLASQPKATVGHAIIFQIQRPQPLAACYRSGVSVTSVGGGSSDSALGDGYGIESRVCQGNCSGSGILGLWGDVPLPTRCPWPPNIDLACSSVKVAMLPVAGPRSLRRHSALDGRENSALHVESLSPLPTPSQNPHSCGVIGGSAGWNQSRPHFHLQDLQKNLGIIASQRFESLGWAGLLHPEAMQVARPSRTTSLQAIRRRRRRNM